MGGKFNGIKLHRSAGLDLHAPFDHVQAVYPQIRNSDVDFGILQPHCQFGVAEPFRDF